MTRRWVSHPTAWRDIHGLQAWEEPMSARFTEEWLVDYQARQQHDMTAGLVEERLVQQEQEPENRFQARVVAFAKAHAWEHYHTHRSDKSPAGFPDLVLVRETVLYAELKTNTGKLTMPQQRWLSLLARAGSEVHVWRPRDFAAIKARLEKRVISS